MIVFEDFWKLHNPMPEYAHTVSVRTSGLYRIIMLPLSNHYAV